MVRGKEYRPEEIIPKLREAEVLMAQEMRQELAASSHWRPQISATPEVLDAAAERAPKSQCKDWSGHWRPGIKPSHSANRLWISATTSLVLGPPSPP